MHFNNLAHKKLYKSKSITDIQTKSLGLYETYLKEYNGRKLLVQKEHFYIFYPHHRSCTPKFLGKSMSCELLSEDNRITTTSIAGETLEIDNIRPNVNGNRFLSHSVKAEMMDAAAEESPSNSARHSALGQDMPPLSKVRPNFGPNPSSFTLYYKALKEEEKGKWVCRV